jgi:hypothetical protein
MQANDYKGRVRTNARCRKGGGYVVDQAGDGELIRVVWEEK